MRSIQPFTWMAAFIAGLILPLAFAPYSWLVCLYLGLILFYGLMNQASPRHAFFLGWLFGLGWFVGVSWVVVTLHHFGGMAWPLAGLSTLLFCAYLALYPALSAWAWSLIVRRLGLSPLARALSFAHLFSLAEWARGEVLSGFPWLSPGYAHAINGDSFFALLSLAALSPWVGVLGLTWLTVFISALIAEWLLFCHQRRVHPTLSLRSSPFLFLFPFPLPLVFALITALALPAIAQIAAISWTSPLQQKHTVVLVQSNTDIREKWLVESYTRLLSRTMQLAHEAISSLPSTSTSQTQPLIIFPETTLSWFAEEHGQDFINAVQTRAALLIGGVDKLNALPTNSAKLFAQGQSVQTYHKHHLVPFGEYPPLGFSWFARRLSIPMANFSAGDSAQPPLLFNGVKWAVSICYENLFPQEQRKASAEANVLVNISNTGWYGDSWAMPQHLQISQMRALEARKPLIHVADTGVSALINAEGIIEQKLAPLSRGTIRGEVQPRQGMTPYHRMGDYPLVLLMIFGLAWIVYWGWQRLRRMP